MDRDGRLRGERPGELLVPGAVGPDRPLDLFHRREAVPEFRLAVDQLERADRLALRRAHRHHQHRLGTVAGLVVERAVDPERRPRRRRVGVLEVEGVPGQRDVSCDAGARQRQPRRTVGDLDRVVLGQSEAQPPGAVGVLLDKVERAGIALRDLPRLGQDGLEQLTRVALGGEPDADRVQLGELPIESRHGGRAVEIVERVLHGARENRPAHARREQPVPVFGPRAGGVGVDEGQDAQRRVAPPPVGDVRADQHHGRRRRGQIRRRGQRGDVERVAEKLGRGRRRARGRVVQNTTAHGTKVGRRLRRSQERVSRRLKCYRAKIVAPFAM